MWGKYDVISVRVLTLYSNFLLCFLFLLIFCDSKENIVVEFYYILCNYYHCLQLLHASQQITQKQLPNYIFGHYLHQVYKWENQLEKVN